MEYIIHLGCRAQALTYYKIDASLKKKIKSSNDIEALFFEELQKHQAIGDWEQTFWVGDRFALWVTDNHDKQIFSSTNPKEIPFLGQITPSCLVNDGLWFIRESTFKQAGWRYYLNSREKFDPKELGFARSGYAEDGRNSKLQYFDYLIYNEEFLENEEEGLFEEQYYHSYVISSKNGKWTEIDPEDL